RTKRILMKKGDSNEFPFFTPSILVLVGFMVKNQF
ncbi:MAG: hypothetical protein ACJAWO_002121, partial [Halieaceae bacterium]